MLRAAAGVPPEQPSNSRDGGCQHVDLAYGGAKRGSGTRDLFPLPLLPVAVLRPGHGLSRAVAQRVNRRYHRGNACNDLISGLNDIFYASGETCTGNATAPASTTHIRAAQRAAQLRLLEASGSFLYGPSTCTAYEAAYELLGNSLSYNGDGDRCNVRPYNRTLVSMPQAGSAAPAVESLLDSSTAEIVGNFEDAMLLAPDAWERVIESEPPIRPYMDEKLKRSASTYHVFVQDLFASNIIDFTDDPRDIVTPFFVGKKDKDNIRMVFDCRVPNRRFIAPPSMSMGTGGSWSRVQLGDEVFYIAQSDIKDCFWNVGLGKALGSFFCLPPVSLTKLARLGIPTDKMKSRGDLCWPRLRRVPMGWSWAFYLIQRAHSLQVLIGSGLSPSRQITDDAPVPDLSS